MESYLFIASLAAGMLACSSAQPASPGSAQYSAPVLAGRIETDEVTESSGLAASRCQDVLWTHNDAGSGPFLFAMDLQGRHLGTWRVEGAESVDWESLAGFRDGSGKCWLFIGDIGDNESNRAEVAVYRIPEPTVTPEAKASRISSPIVSARAEVMTFNYADGPHDAEALLIHLATGDLYIVTKEKKGPAAVHRVRQAFGSGTAAASEKIAEVTLPSDPPGLVTGGDFSPDGKRVMLCDKKGGYEMAVPDGAAAEAIWAARPAPVDIGDRKQGEGVSYARDGKSVFATSEKKNAPIYLIQHRS